MKLKIIKKFLIIILCVCLAITLIVGGLIGVNAIYTRSVHDSVEDLKELRSELSNVPIESCQFVWHPESYIPFGGVLEDVTSGKMTVEKEYYDFILSNYKWALKRGIPREISDHSGAYVYKGLTEFFNYERYYYSEEYQQGKRMHYYLSTNTCEIYFYYYQM